MIKIGSYYINNFEYILAQNDVFEGNHEDEGQAEFPPQRPSSLVDRPELVRELYLLEFDFQFAKVRFIEQLMEAYEHVCDPLESVRIL